MGPNTDTTKQTCALSLNSLNLRKPVAQPLRNPVAQLIKAKIGQNRGKVAACVPYGGTKVVLTCVAFDVIKGVGRDCFQSGTSEARPQGELLRIRCLFRKRTLERSAASVKVGS